MSHRPQTANPPRTTSDEIKSIRIIAAPSPDYLSPQPELMVFPKANQAGLAALTKISPACCKPKPQVVD
jgi:hypothetical protein